MTDALERLAELVRQAESKTRAQKLGQETRVAAERLEVAEERLRLVEHRLGEVRPARMRDLQRADSDEALLKELVKKLAHSLNSLDAHLQREAEQQITSAQEQIGNLRREAQAELESTLRETQAARVELREAHESYHKLRKEMDELLPHLAGEFAADDRLARSVAYYFPAGQIQALAFEIDDGERHYGMLDQREQFAQLKIWVGRYRRLQALIDDEPGDLTEEDHQRLREIFPRLVGVSKQYMPGYIEAFSRTFETDWDSYVSEATEQLRLASDNARRDRDSEQKRREAMARDQERERQSRHAARQALDAFREELQVGQLADVDPGAFLDRLASTITVVGMSDPELLELVLPYDDLLTGPEFRALRRNLERFNSDEARVRETETLRASLKDLHPYTRGCHAVLVGGDQREERRRLLEQVFEFSELEWVAYENARPAMLKSLEQRVRNRGLDLMLILKEFVGHHVTESLRPLCEEQGIPCLLVDHGYGANQIADALRKGINRLAPVDESDEAQPQDLNGRGH